MELTITTNGMFLKNFAEFFKEHKVRVNISLDTLNEEKFKKYPGSTDYQISFTTLTTPKAWD